LIISDDDKNLNIVKPKLMGATSTKNPLSDAFNKVSQVFDESSSAIQNYSNLQQTLNCGSYLGQREQVSNGLDRPFQCEYPDCHLTFLTKGHLKTHQLNHQ
jgi:hypothetical protein